MIQKILCRLGFHEWVFMGFVPGEETQGHTAEEHRCLFCPAERRVVTRDWRRRF